MKKIIYTIILANLLFASNGYKVIETNGCLFCHAIASKKNAPAFAGIAKKNLRFYGSDAKDMIIHSIKNGSSGKYRRFSGVDMPSFKDMSNSDLDAISDFILSQASKAKGHSGMYKGGKY